MNFIKDFKKGQEGTSRGLSMGEGLKNISDFVGGVQRKRYYGVASPPKAGKSTIVDEGFIIEPWLDALERNVPIEFIYYSFEMDRVTKEFDFATYFLHKDYGYEEIPLPEGITFDNGKKTVPLSPDYLRGRKLDDNGNLIRINEEVEESLKEVYLNRIVPLFGEWDEEGNQLRKGYIEFVEQKENPTGIYLHLVEKARQYGKVQISGKKTMSRYARTSDYNKFTIVVIDHMRKLVKERGFSLKETVDKMSEYLVEIRNFCEFTLVGIIHTNRNLNPSGYTPPGTEIYPDGDHLKETGNMSEDVDYLLTLMNPNDDKYNITEHFGEKVRDSRKALLDPTLRTVHLVESRHTYFPEHFKVSLKGNLKHFKQYKKK